MATHSNILSCLENPMDRGTWWATVHGFARESNMTGRLNNKSPRETVQVSPNIPLVCTLKQSVGHELYP